MSKTPDYSFMRAGVGIPGENTPRIDEEFLENMTSILSAFIERAAELAADYAEHSGKDSVGTGDIAQGMCYLCIFYNTAIGDDFQQRVYQHFQSMTADQESESDDLEEEEPPIYEEDDDLDPSSFSEDVTQEDCGCDFCENYRRAQEIWPRWEPKSMMQTILKKAIDNHLL